jgi:hypothetical protein
MVELLKYEEPSKKGILRALFTNGGPVIFRT